MMSDYTVTTLCVPVNVSADVGHLDVATYSESTCQVQTMPRISLEQLMVMCKCITKHLIQPGEDNHKHFTTYAGRC